ncbi:hypothetical protein BGZ93_001543 [Podila epicladia]|nr:hypothetical protein BGZ92_008734 [Podila epicladia]KAG0097968.1 hypothetical protein BGZ93_001543 [Podila epicladia]
MNTTLNQSFNKDELQSRLLILQRHQRRSVSGDHRLQIDDELRQQTHDTIQEILARLQRHHDEAAFEGLTRVEHLHRIHPSRIKFLDAHPAQLQQSHGNANLHHRATATG